MSHHNGTIAVMPTFRPRGRIEMPRRAEEIEQ
jgi:hypothetical protein